jgi:hypothetical protein
MKAKTLWRQDGTGKLTTLKQMATSRAARKRDYMVADRIYQRAKTNGVR